jgi:hypothetical protein
MKNWMIRIKGLEYNGVIDVVQGWSNEWQSNKMQKQFVREMINNPRLCKLESSYRKYFKNMPDIRKKTFIAIN